MHSTNYDNNTAASTWWLRNASFLRLKNIEVGYNFKEKTLKKSVYKLCVFICKETIFVYGMISKCGTRNLETPTAASHIH